MLLYVPLLGLATFWITDVIKCPEKKDNYLLLVLQVFIFTEN